MFLLGRVHRLLLHDRLRSAAACRAAAAASCAGIACTAIASIQQPPTQNAAASSWWSSGGKSADPNIHLRYFDARGAAETSRLLMALAGQPFTEDRWSIDLTRLSATPDQMSPGMAAARQEGKLAANLDRAPVLVVDGTDVGQSKAIERFLARRLGLMGKDELEAGRIDCFSEHIRDIREKYQKAKSTAGEEQRKAALSEFWASSLPELFKLMERVCDGKSSSGALIGSALSYADVCMYVLTAEYFDNKQGVQDALKGCPKLMASAKAVGSHPNVVKYLGARPVTKV